MTHFPDGLPSEGIRPIPRQPDGDGFSIYFSGGFRATMFDTDKWWFEPVLSDGEAVSTGLFSSDSISELAKEFRLNQVGRLSYGWSNGEFHSSWLPTVYGRKVIHQGPSDLWSAISSNLRSARMNRNTLEGMNEEEVASILDDQRGDEMLARYISMSLRGMDSAIEKISEFYFERLTDELYSGARVGRKKGRITDVHLEAEVHSFFLHYGSARDYFGAFIANDLGEPFRGVDSFEKLRRRLNKSPQVEAPIIDALLNQSVLARPSLEQSEWSVEGWLKELNGLRNQFVHTRPYGSKFVETNGWISEVDPQLELYRYQRPIALQDGSAPDLLDLLSYFYAHFQRLMFDAAGWTGRNSEMITLTDKDIVSVQRSH